MCKPVQGKSLTSLRTVIDLNCEGAMWSAVSSKRRRHEQWTEPVFSTHLSLASSRVSPVCATLCWQLSGKEFFLLGPVSRDDVRAIELSGKSARHRRLPALARTPALSSGNPRPDLAQHAGRRQRDPRLANLCRLCAGADPGGAAIVSGRRLGTRSGQHGLCAGFHNHRSVHGAVSLGVLHAEAARFEIAHAVGSARADSHVSARYTGTRSRRQHSRPTHSGTRRFLHHGSRLPQLRTALSLDIAWRLLCHPATQELSLCPTHLVCRLLLEKKQSHLQLPPHLPQSTCTIKHVVIPS